MNKYLVNIKNNFNMYWFFQKNLNNNFIDSIKTVNDNSLNYIGFFDGCSKGNPGKSGCGFVIYDNNNKKVYENNFFLGYGTNNRSEHIGLLYLLYTGHLLGIKKINIFGDSKLVIKHIKGEYKLKDPNLMKICLLSKNIIQNYYEETQFNHIRRELNAYADKLSNKVII